MDLKEIIGLTAREGVLALVASLAIGFVGQWLKSFQHIDTRIVQAGMVVLSFVFWWLIRWPEAGHIREWIVLGSAFAIISLGAASGYAGYGLAPKTDSIKKD